MYMRAAGPGPTARQRAARAVAGRGWDRRHGRARGSLGTGALRLGRRRPGRPPGSARTPSTGGCHGPRRGPVSRQRYDPAEVVRRYVVEGEGVVTIARALGTRPSYVLRLLLFQGVYERHRPSHSEWAREHAAGKVADAEPESPIAIAVVPPAPMRTVPAPPDRDPVAAYLARLGPLHRPKL